MAKYNFILGICIFFVLIAFGIDTASRCKEVELQLQSERFERELKEAEYEKEIRLLKQDINILKYGYDKE